MLAVFESEAAQQITHLDGNNTAAFLPAETVRFMERPKEFQVVRAHAYIGARGIKRALDHGSDIVICKFQIPFKTINSSKQAVEYPMLAQLLVQHGGGTGGTSQITTNWRDLWLPAIS
jgi:hypothetical protein